MFLKNIIVVYSTLQAGSF